MAVADGLRSSRSLCWSAIPFTRPGDRTGCAPSTGSLGPSPCLFVSGTRDAFAAPAELERESTVIAGPVTTRWVEGGDHGLRRRDDQVALLVTSWLSSQALEG